MHKKLASLLLASAMSLCAPVMAAPNSAPAAIAPILSGPDAVDVWTYAQPHVARVTHVSLDLDVDFAAQTMGGKATLDILAAAEAKEIILDSENLAISSITDAKGRALPFTIGTVDANLGAPINVTLNGATRIIITYRSAVTASALQWLPPEMTVGKTKAYVFSQGQAIHNRS